MFVHTLQPQSSFPPTQNGLFKQSRSDKEDLMCSRSNGSVPTCLVLLHYRRLIIILEDRGGSVKEEMLRKEKSACL